MKCEEIQPLHGVYLDSELDAKTILEIQQHLAACPDCARTFAAETKLDAQIASGLKRGQRTAALWAHIEKRVAASAESDPRRPSATRESPRLPWWRELLWPSPQAWAGLAAVWIVILAASFATREPVPVTEARQVAPLSPEMRQMLREQRQMFAELKGGAERFGGGEARPVAPQPRSQRHEELMNT